MKKETMLLSFPRTKELTLLTQRPLAAESPHPISHSSVPLPRLSFVTMRHAHIVELLAFDLFAVRGWALHEPQSQA